jgi:1-acyl-sn-glycerol-3-phosphate acyltransferase
MTAGSGALSRDGLIEAILAFVADRDLLTRQEIRSALEREVDSAGPDALLALRSRLHADNGWSYYPPDPLARRIHHLLADRFLGEGSDLRGAHYLQRVAGAPIVLVANHLSYADANVIDVLLQRFGEGALADRLTALAGPKVFTSRERRFSSLCFGTVKVPQSTDVASGDAVLSARETARAARQAIDTALERLRGGDVLVLFGEGTRSRSAQMQPMLAGTARYLDEPGTWVLPAGLTGPEALFPVEGSELRPARLVLQLGQPLRVTDLAALANHDRRVMMDAIGLAVASLVPPAYRGEYDKLEAYAAAKAVLAAAIQEGREDRETHADP